MGLVGCLGFVGLTPAVATGISRFQPALVAQPARRTGVDGTTGGTIAVLAALWIFLPVLGGSETDGADRWLVGPAVAGVG